MKFFWVRPKMNWNNFSSTSSLVGLKAVCVLWQERKLLKWTRNLNFYFFPFLIQKYHKPHFQTNMWKSLDLQHFLHIFLQTNSKISLGSHLSLMFFFFVKNIDVMKNFMGKLLLHFDEELHTYSEWSKVKECLITSL